MLILHHIEKSQCNAKVTSSLVIFAVLVLRVVLTRFCKLWSIIYSYLLFLDNYLFSTWRPFVIFNFNNLQILTFRTVYSRNLHVPAKFHRDQLNGSGVTASFRFQIASFRLQILTSCIFFAAAVCMFVQISSWSDDRFRIYCQFSISNMAVVHHL